MFSVPLNSLFFKASIYVLEFFFFIFIFSCELILSIIPARELDPKDTWVGGGRCYKVAGGRCYKVTSGRYYKVTGGRCYKGVGAPPWSSHCLKLFSHPRRVHRSNSTVTYTWENFRFCFLCFYTRHGELLLFRSRLWVSGQRSVSPVLEALPVFKLNAW